MSEPALSTWSAQSGWDGLAQGGRFGRSDGTAGVRLEPLDHRALATLLARAGKGPALAEAIRTRFSLDLPKSGAAAFGAAGDLVWAGPGQWLAVAPAGHNLADLAADLDGLAAVTDQGDARALVAIGGRDARDMLAKGLSIDLDPAVFVKGSAAVTSLAHIAVQIWQTADTPVFILAVPRSFAGSLWSWLLSASAEFGCEVAPGRG